VNAVGVLEQILLLPLAYIWLPGLSFLVVVGTVYWLVKPPMPRIVEPPAIDVQSDHATVGEKEKKGKEQRNMHRRQGNPVEVHIAPPDDKTKPEVGSVMDRSVGGLRLAVFHELAIGTVIAVHPVHADAIVPWVDLEVRSCKPSTEMPGQFEVGCQYVKSPPYSIQLLFG
jgi:hypothetical protein